jgi:hypothetical protein
VQDVVDDSLVLVLPLAYLLVLSTLIGCSLPTDRRRVARLTAIAFLALSVPFGASLWLAASGAFELDLRRSGLSPAAEATRTALATIAATATSFALLALLFWWLHRRAWLPDRSRLISTWLCAVALVILFSFGRFISLHGSDIDSIWVDLALGVVGTWLVAKILMPWAMAEFSVVLVNPDRITLTKLAAALILALVMLVVVVHGMATLSPSPPDLSTADLIGFGLSPWLIPIVFAAGSIGLVSKLNLARSPRPLLAAFALVWVTILLVLTGITHRGALGVRIWIAWFSITCGVFVAEGFYCNSTVIPAIPRRRSTWPWTIYMALSSGLAASLALTTALLGLLIGIATCVAFIAALVSVARIVLHLDMSMPRPECAAHFPIPTTLYGKVAAGVLQDAGSGGVLAVFFGFVPLILFSMVGLSTSFLSFVVFYSGFVAIGMGFVVHADVHWLDTCTVQTFVHEETAVADRPEALRAYHRHIAFHTFWTIACLWPISLLQWLELPMERILREGEVSTNIWNTVERLGSAGRAEDGHEEPAVRLPAEPES